MIPKRKTLLAIGSLTFSAIIASVMLFAYWLRLPDAGDLVGYAAHGDINGVQHCLQLGVDLQPDDGFE